MNVFEEVVGSLNFRVRQSPHRSSSIKIVLVAIIKFKGRVVKRFQKTCFIYEKDEHLAVITGILLESAQRYSHLLGGLTKEHLEFFFDVANGRIPEKPPFKSLAVFDPLNMDSFMSNYQLRELITGLGMWGIVTKSWVRELAVHLKGKRVLEIMAGNGYLAKALTEQGVDVIATDDGSWKSEGKRCYPVRRMDAIESVENIEADVLLVSWPPYGCDAVIQAAKVWGSDRQIVYIGEYGGGCNAPEEFFNDYKHKVMDVGFVSFEAIHDQVFIGHWAGGKD